MLADHGATVVKLEPLIMSSVHLLDDGKGVTAIRVRSEDGGHAGRQLSFGGTALVLDANTPERILAVTQGMDVQVGAPCAPSGCARHLWVTSHHSGNRSA
jgi:hypothetical protein